VRRPDQGGTPSSSLQPHPNPNPNANPNPNPNPNTNPNQAPKPEGERQYSSLRGKLLAKGQSAPMAQQSKFAKGPDGTKGFGAPGFDRRGKPLEVANGGDTGVGHS